MWYITRGDANSDFCYSLETDQCWVSLWQRTSPWIPARYSHWVISTKHRLQNMDLGLRWNFLVILKGKLQETDFLHKGTWVKVSVDTCGSLLIMIPSVSRHTGYIIAGRISFVKPGGSIKDQWELNSLDSLDSLSPREQNRVVSKYKPWLDWKRLYSLWRWDLSSTETFLRVYCIYKWTVWEMRTQLFMILPDTE